MDAPQENAMANIERRRMQLEENVSKLRNALKHWRTWEFEYEMLKEEIQAADNPSPDKMVEIGRSLSASLLDEKEILQLVGKDQTKRTANQVIDMMSRRVDYVQQNITTVAKQLDAAEKRLAGTSVLLEPDLENEEGLPLMDIQEELDEEGNVISSSVLQPGKSAPEIVDALRKAGIQKLGKQGAAESEEKKDPPSSNQKDNVLTKEEDTKHLQTSDNAPIKSESTAGQPAPAKKSVSFSEDTKPEAVPEGQSALERTGYNDELADYNFTKGTRVIEVDEDDNEIASYPIIPQGESPEDAELRRQMLQYGLSEVGRVVAEIDLDGPDEGYSDEMEDYDSDEDESELEDEYGRSLKREITDEYRAKMLELERKLNARMLENVGPRPDTHPLAEFSDDVRTVKIRNDAEFDESMSKENTSEAASQKKGVRFADHVDIAPVSPPGKDQIDNPEPGRPAAPTISDTIVERTGPAAEQPSAGSPKPAKVSRFRSARAATTQSSMKMLPTPSVPEPLPVPQGPKGQTLASTIVEHDHQASEPHVPDEFDPVVVNREIQIQYHKMRNRMIQQQGGFKPTQEEEDYPLIEEQDGKTKKVSRFRAARLKADGL
ncbi:uncharacterized protein EI97DRAFT_147375 [Westerdykella ornata]|uniref:DUF3835 domain-containing protein n=1 Tax=Westerdykella ornata TaxID=318751 RepID=A0A6A6JDB3_WESOR|nr:uncharacterized protein EI97DRAFT_147375 [Westerdykella ornata]KAF2273616.1 hypothetical protein EI97DRAFT_147375 [Westerdykella ornata]